MGIGHGYRTVGALDVDGEGGDLLDAGAVAQVGGDRRTGEQRRGDDGGYQVEIQPAGDRVERAVVLAVEGDVRGGVAEVDADAQRPGEADLVSQLEHAFEFVGTVAGHRVHGFAGVE